MDRASTYIDALKFIQDLGQVPDIHKKSLTVYQLKREYTKGWEKAMKEWRGIINKRKYR